MQQIQFLQTTPQLQREINGGVKIILVDSQKTKKRVMY